MTKQERYRKGDRMKTTTAWLTMLIAVLIVGLVASLSALVEACNKVEKYEAVLDMSCTYAAHKTECLQGVNVLKNMDVKTIRSLGRGAK